MPLRAPEGTDEPSSIPNSIPSSHSAPIAHSDPVVNGHHVDSTDTIYPVCAALAAKINVFLEEENVSPLLQAVQAQTRVAMGVISETLERYTLEEISLSYNGGKDCLVLLILLLASLSKHHSKSPSTRPLPALLPAVYIISPHPFAEVDAFVLSSASDYRLALARYAMPMKEAFRVYLQEYANVKAILVGTRRTDPHGGKLTHFDQTDHGWPAFMRVHPVIDWHYREVWAFIRHLEIPYCALYDQGYTSLGGTTDTHPNPALKAAEGAAAKDSVAFRPAYELVEDEEERLGRDW